MLSEEKQYSRKKCLSTGPKLCCWQKIYSDIVYIFLSRLISEPINLLTLYLIESKAARQRLRKFFYTMIDGKMPFIK
jgi:ABC-type phosphate transport system permease subunit